MFATALHTYHMAGDEPPDLRGYVQDLCSNYTQRAAQCIWAADITAPNQDSVTCMMLYWINEFYWQSHASVGLWLVQSLIVRKAILMGYHRDPSSFPSIKPLEAELRRRMWHSICQSDLLLSFHLGLPSMIDYGATDVLPPRSLHEEELYEQMEVLPPERPATEPTPVSYTIAKMKVFQVFGKVVHQINSMRVPSDDQVALLNQELADTYNNTFPHLRRKPYEEGEGDPLEIRMQRLTMQGFYNKAICVLNRRYILMQNPDEFARSSKLLCIQNAIELLDAQNTMQHHGYRWEQFLYARNDFLLATVIICLALYTSKRTEYGTRNPWAPNPQTEEYRLKQILERTRQHWMSCVDKVPDAGRALQVIDTMLQRIQNEKQSSAAPSGVDDTKFNGQSTGTSAVGPTPDSMADLTQMDWSSWDSLIHGTQPDVLLANGNVNGDALWQPDSIKM